MSNLEKPDGQLHRRKREQRCTDELLSTGTDWLHSFDSERSGRRAAAGPEGAPDEWLEIEPQFAEALLGVEVDHELIVITWLHEAKRDVLKGHPRNDPSRPLTGVFYTRSPSRPNPLGLHPVTVREIEGTRLKIGPIGRLFTASAFDDTSGANFPLRVRHRVRWRVPLPRNSSCRYSTARR
jgi:hypothetical protein